MHRIPQVTSQRLNLFFQDLRILLHDRHLTDALVAPRTARVKTRDTSAEATADFRSTSALAANVPAALPTDHECTVTTRCIMDLAVGPLSPTEQAMPQDSTRENLAYQLPTTPHLHRDQALHALNRWTLTEKMQRQQQPFQLSGQGLCRFATTRLMLLPIVLDLMLKQCRQTDALQGPSPEVWNRRCRPTPIRRKSRLGQGSTSDDRCGFYICPTRGQCDVQCVCYISDCGTQAQLG